MEGNTMKKLAKLTTEENKSWDKYFAFYVEQGMSDHDAAEQTWKDLQSEFPRLRKYEGAQA